MLDSEIIHNGLVVILCCEAGVGEVFVDVVPLAQAAVVEHLQFVGDDEGNDTVCQAFLEHEEATHAPVAVLERMNALETHVEVENVFQRLCLLAVVICQQRCHCAGNVLGQAGVDAAYLVGQAFVVAHGKPFLATVGSSRL